MRTHPLQADPRRCSILWEKPFIRVEQDVFLRGHPLNAILSSLAAFLAAGVQRRTPLAKAIMLVLVIKLIAIAGMGVFTLRGSGRPVVDPIAVSRLIGPSVSLPNEGGR